MDARRPAGIVSTQCRWGEKGLNNSGSPHKRGNQRRAPSHSAYIKRYSLCREVVSSRGGAEECWVEPHVRPPTVVAIPREVCLHKSWQACSCSISDQHWTFPRASELHCTSCWLSSVGFTQQTREMMGLADCSAPFPLTAPPGLWFLIVITA